MSSTEPSRSIRLLDDPVISGIAAGEVVERPASIVKELVENSLDAGATKIVVEYDDSAEKGRRGLAVVDDGHGIVADELDLAVTRHATSKIRSLDDLSSIGSFGFRGEALASIAAVSECEVVSRTADSDGGARVCVRHGELVERAAAGARPGTRVAVSDLFSSVPARRKFLKSAAAEYSAVADVVRRMALANPAVHISLVRNGKVVADYVAVDGLGARLRQVFGRELATSMVELETRHQGMALRGALTPAGVSFGSARRIFIFVGGRFVQERSLFRALMEGYRTYLLKGRYPAAALFLEASPAEVDVNVHPAKLEVRFSDPELVQRFVAESVRETLRGEASPLGRWGLTEGDLLRGEVDARRRSVQGADPQRGSAPGSTPTPASEPATVEVPAGYVESRAPAPAPVVAEQQPVALDPAPGADLEVIGQIFAGYIVCQRGEEVVLVDQHAAHERVLFERLMAGYDRGEVESQPLLLSVTLAVGGEGVAAVAAARDELAKLGWDVEPFGDEDVVVRAVPRLAGDSAAAELVEKLVADLVRTDAGTAGRRLAEQVYASVACHSAVRVGKRLDKTAAAALLSEIATVDFAASCPHGRPVSRTITRGELERMFGR